MPLPTASEAARAEWPPPSVARYTRQQDQWAAWWAGDVDKLRTLTGARSYWHRDGEANRNNPGGRQARSVHVALAADIVSTSADLLFGDAIGLVIPEPENTGEQGEQVDTDVEGLAAGDASTAQEQAAHAVTQARLDELRDDLDLDGTLLEAGEVAAALGGAWLRPAWDVTVHDGPLLTVIDPNMCVPEYRMRQLVAVTFWEVVEKEDGGRVWRHLERHEVVATPDGPRGVILHGLYDGTHDRLGTPRGLTRHAATAGLDELVHVPEGAGPIMPRYMPNVLPNRKSRRLPIGRSDFDGIEDELDALDETWSALLRDVRLGVARLMVPEGTLERPAGGGAGSGKTFDVDRELMVETDAAPDEQGGRVSLMQGEVRAESLLAVIRAIVESAVSGAGYAPATFGLGIDGAAESGTARAIRERKTFRTLDRKRRYAARAVCDVLVSLLAIDAAVFGRDVVPMRPRVEWPDVALDERAVAERLQLLRAAQAISIRRAVMEAAPDLTPAEVDEEVAAILGENAVASDPVGMFGDRPGSTDAEQGDDPFDAGEDAVA